MVRKAKRAALYLRVSTDRQTVENQRRELAEAAAQRGWTVVAEHADNGISGSKGREHRPGLDALLKDTARGKFDVVMAWSVDRLGRSLPDLIGTLQELHGARCDLFLHQQGIDTTTPAGKAMFGMMGVFAEFERAMIQERVNAGLARARGAGVKLGRPRISAETETAIRDLLGAGMGMLKVAREIGCGTCVVQRIAREMRT
jgi:DNA invertase Pin-like site-specific DNA recombinase